MPKGSLSFGGKRPEPSKSVGQALRESQGSTNDDEEEEFKGLSRKENYLAHLNNLNNLKALQALRSNKSRLGQNYLCASISNINSIDIKSVLSDIKSKSQSNQSIFTAKAFVFRQKPSQVHNASQAAL